ncbi:putative secretion ATPase (PEP-CTERM system associated) [Sphingobium fontiphilum]|uniref:Putative secretion ATPase (PEP-CTERM system associated) n=1 Tax=Sphingobium fontiphilum TaxID=944425 RepID=A0A7W6DJZ7_9SPHN|nr:XrtA/PEP-CTERM system-associated ATPase [Sphingobium fontiphilum]MBB3980459.1 putative secretion ATPase (PEP-CTERM system associated) [Sphingobium fontiphilum]
MYDQFYGLQGRPFQLTPDPHFYFESATHRKALSYLGYGLAQGEGFIVITGDIGAGKTTLVAHLMATVDPSRLTAVKIVSTQVGGDDMLRLAAQSFGLASDGVEKAQLLQRIEAFLHGQARAGRRTLLIVDEAQNLPVSAIEELRMLSNFQLGGQSLLQIFLLGQPEFRDLLKSPQLEQLRQRVIATHHLEPMMAGEVEPYIIHRLSVAGWQGDPAITQQAFAAIYAATAGVPRRVNALASRVLLMGAIEQLHSIDVDVVNAVVADMVVDTDVLPEPVAPSSLDEAVEPVFAPLQEEAGIQQADELEASQEWPMPPIAQDHAEAVEPASAVKPEIAVAPVAPFAGPVPSFAAPSPVAVHQPDAVAHDEDKEPAEDEVLILDGDEDAWQIDEGPVAEVAPFTHAPVEDREARDEIAELRAEVVGLRAAIAQLSVQPAREVVDPQALRDCLTIIDQRLNTLEQSAQEQENALRKVLGMLIDWVEREDRMTGSAAA